MPTHNLFLFFNIYTIHIDRQHIFYMEVSSKKEKKKRPAFHIHIFYLLFLSSLTRFIYKYLLLSIYLLLIFIISSKRLQTFTCISFSLQRTQTYLLSNSVVFNNLFVLFYIFFREACYLFSFLVSLSTKLIACKIAATTSQRATHHNFQTRQPRDQSASTHPHL